MPNTHQPELKEVKASIRIAEAMFRCADDLDEKWGCLYCSEKAECDAEWGKATDSLGGMEHFANVRLPRHQARRRRVE